MSKVLVKSAMYQYQMGPDGLQRYYTLGGSGRRAQPGEVRGRTKRNRALDLTGAVAGGLFGLAGESRSAGGFLGNIISGAEQGSRFGRGLANLATSRTRQARADILEGEKQAKIRSDAEAQLRGEREMKRRRGLDRRELSLEQIRDMGPSPNRRRILPGIGRRNMTQFGHELAAYQTEQEAIAAEQAKREQKQRDAMEAAGLKPNIEALQRIEQINNPELLDAALAAGHVRGLTLGEMAQQQQVPQQQVPQQQVNNPDGFTPPEGSVKNKVGTDADNNNQLNDESNKDHQMNTESIQSELGSQDEEELPIDNQRLRLFMERIGEPGAENE